MCMLDVIAEFIYLCTFPNTQPKVVNDNMAGESFNHLADKE